MDNRVIDFENDFTDEEAAVFKTEAGKVTTEEEAVKNLMDKLEESEPISEEEVIIKKYKLGVTLKQITTEHNISYGKVYAILANHNVPLRSGRYSASKSQSRIDRMTQLEKESLVIDYKSGMMMEDIYKKYDINKHGTYQILDEANVPRRERHIGYKEIKDTADEMIENINNAPQSATDTRYIDLTKGVKIEEVGDSIHAIISKSAIETIEQITIKFK